MTQESKSSKEPLIKRGVGVSQVLRKKLSDNLPKEKLHCLLTSVGWLVNYEFDDQDWEEISEAIGETSFESADWYDFELVGSHSARVKVAQEKDVVHFEINVPAELLPQLRFAIQIFATFELAQ